MQRLLASARALASDGSSASIAEPLHEAEEDHATIRNVFGFCLALCGDSDDGNHDLESRRDAACEVPVGATNSASVDEACMVACGS
jgi:hypothetical protein